MSMLVTDVDEAATLEATLAFLDEWDSPPRTAAVQAPQ